MPTKFLGTVRPKFFAGKTWYPLSCIKISTESRDMPALIHKFHSEPENFRKIEGFLYKAFRFGPVRQKTVRQNRDAPSSYAWKFSIKEFFWNTKVISNGIFRYSATKTFRRKIVIRFPPFLLSMNNFSLQKISKTQNGSLAQFSRFREIKKLSTKP